MDGQGTDPGVNAVFRLGVVSFLNSRPLIAGLDADPRVTLAFDVPAALPGRLDRGEVDAALVPIIDVLRRADRWRIVSDAGIGCDGETMTVRVFSQVPPDRIATLWADTDSHTSVALATVLWRELFGRELELRRLDARSRRPDDLPAVLLIGDKVVDPGRGRFAYEVDLGGAWRQHTGLPFVFAVWAAPNSELEIANSELGIADGGLVNNESDSPNSLLAPRYSELAALLVAARDRGVEAAAEIAERDGPRLGWPVELARRYLTQCLTFRLDGRHVAGAELFAQHCQALGLVPPGGVPPWPTGPSAAATEPAR